MTLSLSNPNLRQMLSNIIDHVVNGVTEGFNDLDPFGQEAQIFLDVVSNVGDYPTAQHVQT